MPFVSRAQAKWAFATKQPWARKWGHKTRLAGGIEKLPQYVARKGRKWGKHRVSEVETKEVPSATPALGNASGPGGLFSHPALERTNAPTTRRRVTREDRIKRRQRPQITTKEGEGHSGAIVAFYLPIDVACTVGQAGKDLFADRAEPAPDLHVTLAYLGQMDEIEDVLPKMVATIQRYVQTWLHVVGTPITATLRGYDSFDTVQEDGSIPIYRVVDSSLLKIFVSGLDSTMESAGVPIRRDYGAYTPHVTVAYTYPELAALLPATPATATPVQFSKVMLCLGDVQIELPLVVEAFKANAADSAPTAKPAAGGSGGSSLGNSKGGHKQIAPGVYLIKGNLCQVHGQFGPCDSASSEGFGKKPKKPKGGGKGKGGKGGGKGAKPKLTDEEKKQKKDADAQARKAEADAQKAKNRTDTLAKLTNRPSDDAMKVLDTLGAGGVPDPAMAESMAASGLLKKHSDGSYTLSSQGHALQNALDRGDAAGATEAMAGGKDVVSATNDRAAAADQRKQDIAKRTSDRQAALDARRKASASKRSSGSGSGSGSGSRGSTVGSGDGVSIANAPKKGGHTTSGRSSGGGGSGGSSSSPKAARPAAKITATASPTKMTAEEQTAAEALNTTKIADSLGIGDDLANLNHFLSGSTLRVAELQSLYDQGLIDIDNSGAPRSNAQGKALALAAKKGDLRAAQDAQSRANDVVLREQAKNS